jgi:hypothetical protein
LHLVGKANVISILNLILIRKAWKVIRILILLLVLLPVLIFISLQFSTVQTWLAGQVSEYLRATYGIDLHISRVSISINGTVGFEDLVVKDYRGDTLLFSEDIRARGIRLIKEDSLLWAGDLRLIRPYFNLQRYPGDSLTNFDMLLALIPESKDSSSGSTLRNFSLGSIEIQDGRFRYDDALIPAISGRQIDFDHTGVRLNMFASDIVFKGDSLSANLVRFAAAESKGMILENMRGNLRVSARGIFLDSGELKTARSRVIGEIGFETEDWRWSGFIRNVSMRHDLDSSLLSAKDLVWFTEELEGLDKTVEFAGRFRGTVNRLRSRDVWIQWDENSSLYGNIKLEGLPNLEQTFISLDLSSVSTNKREMDRIPLPPFTEGKLLRTPDNFTTLGQVKFEGNFTGFISDFVAFGTIKTDIGNVYTDIKIRENEQGISEYSGDVSTRSFNLGKFYSQNWLGAATAALGIDGEGFTLDDMNTDMSGEISGIQINGYDYSGITLNGTFRKSFFDGLVVVDDPNAMASFEGKIDFTKKDPVLKAEISLDHLDLKELNILKDSAYSSITAYLSLDVIGLDPETATGRLFVEDVSYCTEKDECRLTEISVTANNIAEGRSIQIKSPVADISFSGTFNANGIDMAVRRVLNELFAGIPAKARGKYRKQNFESEVHVKDFQIITDLFLPDISIGSGTRMYLRFDEEAGEFAIEAETPKSEISGLIFENMSADVNKLDSTAHISLQAEFFGISDSLYAKDLNLDAQSKNDTLFHSLSWDSSDKGHSGAITGWIHVRGLENFDVYFGQSQVILNGTPWDIKQDGFIRIDSSRYEARDFRLEHGKEYIRANGIISKLARPKMTIDLQDFDIANIQPFLQNTSVDFSGRVSGNIEISDIYRSRQIISDLIILDLVLDKRDVGDFCLESTWDNSKSSLLFAGELEKHELLPLKFEGTYTPSDETNPLEVDLTLNNFELNVLNPFLTEGISSLSGKADAFASLTGTPERPLLNGEILFKDAGISIDYLGLTYYLNDKARITPDMFTMDNVRFKDPEGNLGRLVGTVGHDNFSNWNFEIVADLENTRMNVLNTTAEMNPVYYGKAYASGYVTIGGYENNLEFDINLKSERGTVISMPIGESEELAFEDFVVFFDADRPIIEEAQDLSGIDMAFELEITPDAEMRIIFDEAAGDVMKGRGQGNVNMEITSEGKFEMYGVVQVIEGNYLFTLKNMINKDFKVLPGGLIAWYGDPLAADINLNTAYTLSAPLYDLMSENKEAYRNRVPVELIMNLSGKLLNPEIAFEIEVPNADELTRSKVRSAISSEEEKNRQAFALLVLKRFISPPNVRNEHTNIGVAENTSEFLTSQFNNWLSQISEDFDIGFNYRPGDEITNNEIALALSTQLFDERLRLSGNFGVNYGTRTNQNPSNIVGDLDVEYDITKDGKFRVIVFNRTNEFDPVLLNSGLTTQGLGVVYQEEFDSVEEFFCRLGQIFRKEEEKVSCNPDQEIANP